MMFLSAGGAALSSNLLNKEVKKITDESVNEKVQQSQNNYRSREPLLKLEAELQQV